MEEKFVVNDSELDYDDKEEVSNILYYFKIPKIGLTR